MEPAKMYHGRRVRLRPFEWKDAQKYRQWVNDSAMVSLVDRALPVTAVEHRRWYESITQDPRHVIFALETLTGKRFVGCIWLYGIDTRHHHAEVRIFIGDTSAWGKGIGKESLSLLADFAFRKLNLHKLYAYVLATNKRALDTFEKSGFAREGFLKKDRYIDGRFVDVIRFGMLRKD